MKDQHTKITGYRDLTQAEIDLMNKIKAKGAELDALYVGVREHLIGQNADANQANDSTEKSRLIAAEPARWASIGRTHFQEGLMAITRAVAQPTTF